ncbi:uncharacterized protein LOC131326714 isoform X1 [Rhododendron vialii]|uniref:uncharacterized protein LOC131326714 isoform X1 n=1 Tax=Rhododendron vialii TaxID=182163 RepID=UPI0026603550|nr:uncharacterized protein LOC131326714 isoform X1 [Rhododendron vialii]
MLTRVSSTLFFLLDPDIQLKRSKTPIIGEVHLSNLEADVRCGKDVYLPFLKASECPASLQAPRAFLLAVAVKPASLGFLLKEMLYTIISPQCKMELRENA